ncbi:MAG: DNA polymerase III subunit delta' [Methylococcaceae bacterium]
MSEHHHTNELLPWLLPQWSWLLSSQAAARIPPALLLHGPSGTGKTALASLWARQLLCRQADANTPCGHCPSCQLFAVGNHPDYTRVEPAEPGKAIGIDAIRQLINKLSLKPQYNGYRVVVIEPAHQLNVNAANALLKTLEEPAPYTLIVLISSAPQKIPVTVLSRCQKLAIPKPAPEQTLTWLAAQGVKQNPALLLDMARGSPLLAVSLDGTDRLAQREQIIQGLIDVKTMGQDPLQLANQWEPLFSEDVIEWIMNWIYELVCLKHPLLRPNSGFRSEVATVQQIIHSVSLADLYAYWDFLIHTRQRMGHNMNVRLLIEELLILWSRPGLSGIR